MLHVEIIYYIVCLYMYSNILFPEWHHLHTISVECVSMCVCFLRICSRSIIKMLPWSMVSSARRTLAVVCMFVVWDAVL